MTPHAQWPVPRLSLASLHAYARRSPVGYLGYYFVWVFLSYAMRQPWLLVGVGVFWLLRRFIPRPGALFRALGRTGRLREQVAVNRANVTARRDLAELYLELLRPRTALVYLEEALALAPDDAELLYLSGVALHRSRRHEDALPRLVRAVEKDSRIRYGEPYLVAGDALLALKRWDSAIDAYERYIEGNSSDVAPYTGLAKAHAGAGDRKAAREALLAGISTWHVLPGSMKRRQFGQYLKAQRARVTVLKDPGAIAVTLVALALVGFGVRVAYPSVVRWITTSSEERAYEDYRRKVLRCSKLCGTQNTGDFAGRYAATLAEDPRTNLSGSLNQEQRGAMQEMLSEMQEQYSAFEIRKDRIVSGQTLVQEFCLTKVLERSPTLLRAQALWHENRDDPGDASIVEVRLEREGEVTRFSYNLPGEPPGGGWYVALRREE